MNTLKNMFLTIILLSATNLIVAVRPTIKQVNYKGEEIFEIAHAYFDQNRLAAISRMAHHFESYTYDKFREFLDSSTGLLFYAKNDDEKKFNETCDTLDDIFGDVWHDLYC